ncbi:ATP-dependent Clp protease ATP-binding subunit [Patescibacteria group bacterium]|nr:MAG: ATP-dependent Clp protease ATP-binding subunit [Patescibacteria group bacterium]
MTFADLEHMLSPWRPVAFLEHIVSHQTRRFLLKIFFALSLILFALASGIVFSEPSTRLSGLFFLSLVVFLLLALWEAYFYSLYFEESRHRLSHSLELVMLVSRSGQDPLLGFFRSSLGSEILERLGIDEDSRQYFLSQTKKIVQRRTFSVDDRELLDEVYFRALLQTYPEFVAFLSSHATPEDLFLRCVRFVLRLRQGRVHRERWWHPDNLARFEGVGKHWTYGRAFTLERLSAPLLQTLPPEVTFHEEEMRALETILGKSAESNALLVGEEGAGKIEVVERLARLAEGRKSNPRLFSRRFLVFATGDFCTIFATREAFERTLARVLAEAHRAGNIVLIIPDLPVLLAAAEALEVNAVEILNPYLRSSDIFIVAVSNTEDFHRLIERNQELMQRFDVVMVRGGTEEEILSLLEGEVEIVESREGVFITYPALVEAVRGAAQYLVSAPLYDAAKDLLEESIVRVREERQAVLMPDDVLTIVEVRTGVPAGGVSSADAALLENLEAHLHQRIVGQDEAIRAISNALRRARAHVGNPNRPLGSFLFLGPTGVGKTETAKALSEIFFGAEGAMTRLDMSEYESADALSRLIGDSLGRQPGVLASLVRERPYGVLLLDEFEKTERLALDLFLQILDEGMFSDASGRKINARNLIIIATSNAGSDLIFDLVKRGQDPSAHREKILDTMISQGIFKAELLNRFDAIVFFHPLRLGELKEVAGLLLKRLEWRLRERGITLAVNDPLLSFLAEKGNDPKFGARALNRAIQDTVEKVVADKIIGGKLRPGSTLELTLADLQGL